MKRVELYIQEHTKRISNLCRYEYDNGMVWEEYHSWLTPDQAKAVAQIAREETINEVCEWIKNHLNDDYISVDEESVRMGCPYSYLETDLFIEDLKKCLEDKV